VHLIEEIVAWFPVGTVIARSGTQVWARSQVAGGP
jgi:hypothetical protein